MATRCSDWSHLTRSASGYEERLRELVGEQPVVTSRVESLHVFVLAAFAYDDTVRCHQGRQVVKGNLVHVLPEHPWWERWALW